MRFSVVIEDAEQISPDTFRNILRIREVNKNTTIGDLLAWQKNLYPYNREIQNEFRFEPMLIQEME